MFDSWLVGFNFRLAFGCLGPGPWKTGLHQVQTQRSKPLQWSNASGHAYKGTFTMGDLANPPEPDLTMICEIVMLWAGAPPAGANEEPFLRSTAYRPPMEGPKRNTICSLQKPLLSVKTWGKCVIYFHPTAALPLLFSNTGVPLGKIDGPGL